MTIPGDQLDRWWVEVGGVNQQRVADLRPGLIAFVAFDPDRVAGIDGCGVLLAAGGDFGVIMTAKHVLTEGVARRQRPHSRSASSSLFIPKNWNKPSIEPKNLKANWMGTQHSAMLNVGHVVYNESLDIALCVAMVQDNDSGLFKPIAIPIDTTVPRVGDLVHLVSLDAMSIVELSGPTERSGVGALLQIDRRVSIRIGVVTGIHAKGYRQYRWPCFTTSIPAEPGMSGGMVFLPEQGKTISTCGIVCADNSDSSAREDQNTCGESVVACAWPTLGMQLPNRLPYDRKFGNRTLYEFMRSGDMPMAVGGIDHIEIIAREDGDYSIRMR